MKKDMGIDAKGIAVDEKTAVCIEANGDARVFGTNKAFFIATSDKSPETMLPDTPLHWNQNQKAIKVYVTMAAKKERSPSIF